jgi:arsenite methyltransferase
MRCTDVLISNVQADLNVYLDTLPDGTKRVSKAESDDQQKSSCCASAPIDGAARRSQGDKTSGCGANQHRADGCCATPGSASEAELDMEKLSAQLGNVDLNEWVGKYDQRCHRPTQHADFQSLRFLQDLSGQALRREVENWIWIGC